MQEDKNRQVCHWCLSEIIWDEEIGPETHCPHCDNELGSYRSMSIGLERGDDEAEQPGSDDSDDEDKWLDDEEDDSDKYTAEEGFRGGSRSLLAAESVIQRIIDEQLEAPECPVCREYMMEAGVQTVGGAGFAAAEPAAVGIPVLPNPFKMVWYVCPACYHTASFLSHADREEMMNRLAARS
ncbi:hypothetical protein D3P08_11680 [Paenibacillus nanensis]|uniref:Uncharacterized protein n=1 Tax=Paenibacillus nanensis TaxID=393251 RepID=A0A3A1V535_9BACL|nr:hypothetical protein [Paenibacillus nanensis]RIX52670.1 hypothetical protein D3P08_11680 [Paenibacillus nanensis]